MNERAPRHGKIVDRQTADWLDRLDEALTALPTGLPTLEALLEAGAPEPVLERVAEDLADECRRRNLKIATLFGSSTGTFLLKVAEVVVMTERDAPGVNPFMGAGIRLAQVLSDNPITMRDGKWQVPPELMRDSAALLKAQSEIDQYEASFKPPKMGGRPRGPAKTSSSRSIDLDRAVRARAELLSGTPWQQIARWYVPDGVDPYSEAAYRRVRRAVEHANIHRPLEKKSDGETDR